MRTYILKRLIISVGILIFVMFLVYTLMRSLPTSYVEQLALQHIMGAQGETGKTYEEWVTQLNSIYNLDKGIFTGFVGWMTRIVTTGDFGDSWIYPVSVVAKFKEVIWNSFFLNIFYMIASLSLSIPLGIMAARKQYSRTDYAIIVFALIGMSLPGFFIAALLQLVFSVKLGWLDLYGMVGKYHNQMTSAEQVGDILVHYIMPVTTLLLTGIGGMVRFTRTNMLEVLNSDYIRTARAKGVSENKVINHHAFRNTLIPIVTMVGGMLPGLFGGAMITEQVFQLPGIGYISLNAMRQGDIPFSMFYMSFLAALTLLGNLIADLLYAVVDPRVRVA